MLVMVAIDATEQPFQLCGARMRNLGTVDVQWLGGEFSVGVSEVVSMLDGGCIIYAGRKVFGGYKLGPRVRRCTLPCGQRSIELAQKLDDWRLSRLPRVGRSSALAS